MAAPRSTRRLAVPHWIRSAFAPVDAASLVFFRVAFGLAMAIEAARYLASDWIDKYWIAPEIHFTYFGFGWVRPWPGDWMVVHWWVLGGLGILIAAGLFYRLAMVAFFLGFAYVFLLDQTTYLNHFYLICLVSFVMMFAPANRAGSVDAWMRPRLASRTIPAWPIWLLRALLGIVYAYAGLAKLNEDWLRAEPIRGWIVGVTSLAPLAAFLESAAGAYFMAYGGLAFDLLVTPALLWRRTRAMAFAFVVVFHVTNALVFSIGIFPWFMLVATTVFFAPCWPRSIASWRRRDPGSPGLGDLWRALTLRPRPLAESCRAGPAPRALATSQWVTFVALVAFVLVQLLVPLRHFLYPGNVHWTEEGHRFSWHMKLRAKAGSALFRVDDEDGVLLDEIDPIEILSERQTAKMSTRPDMILQFAHHLAATYRSRGHDRVAVHARVYCRLNDRRVQLLIDPEVDLAGEPRTLGHADWILPLQGR